MDFLELVWAESVEVLQILDAVFYTIYELVHRVNQFHFDIKIILNLPDIPLNITNRRIIPIDLLINFLKPILNFPTILLNPSKKLSDIFLEVILIRIIGIESKELIICGQFLPHLDEIVVVPG